MGLLVPAHHSARRRGVCWLHECRRRRQPGARGGRHRCV